MQLPFSVEDFLATFRSYNLAIGIAPALLVGLAIALVGLAFTRVAWRHRAIVVGLALLWTWSGAVYHWGFFSRINPAARLFAAIFLVQAIILIVVRNRVQFDPRTGVLSSLGWTLIGYALIVYPLLGWAMGHRYPSAPTFGTPCPTTIFFLGMIVWIRGKIPLAMVSVPLAWAVVATSAAAQLGIREDLGLTVAAVLVIGEMMRRHAGQRAQLRAGLVSR